MGINHAAAAEQLYAEHAAGVHQGTGGEGGDVGQERNDAAIQRQHRRGRAGIIGPFKALGGVDGAVIGEGTEPGIGGGRFQFDGVGMVVDQSATVADHQIRAVTGGGRRVQ